MSLRVVLCVNNSLSGRVAALLLGLPTHNRESWMYMFIRLIHLNSRE